MVVFIINYKRIFKYEYVSKVTGLIMYKNDKPKYIIEREIEYYE